MKKLMVFILFINLLLITPSIKAEFKTIYPLENQIIGAKYSHQFSNLIPYFSSVYAFKDDQIYYQLGTELNYNQQLSYGLNYNYWINSSFPSYRYQQGFIENITYQQSKQELARNLKVSFFQGQIGEDFNEEIKTNYVNLNYNRQLYYDWNNKANFILDITTGQAEEEYYISNLKLPIKYNNFSLIPQVGYIQQGELITPYYDLANYVRGYDKYNQQENKGEQGTQLTAIKLEKTFELFPYSNLPLLNILNGVSFITVGDVLNKEESITDFDLHSSAGIGLALDLVQVDLRLERVITDKGQWKTLFHTTINY